MKLSTAVSLFAASWFVLADAAVIPRSSSSSTWAGTTDDLASSTLDVTSSAAGAGHRITRAERVLNFKRGHDDDDDDDDDEDEDGDEEDSSNDDDDSGSSSDSGDSATPTSSSSGSSSSSTSSSGSSSGDGKTYSGTGTWFIPSTEGGSAGACGGDNEDDAQIVALNQEQYGDTSSKSDWCGKKVEISYKGKSTTATITDACPDCSSGDLDLTQAVFKALESDLDVGELDISWKVVSS